ncbi:MAG: hypothetical protein M0Q88_04940 [Bacilli bacterium]|nr:hypothetical protein [Bacilli bacterium]
MGKFDNVFLGLDDYTNEDKVRYISFKIFSSGLFLWISILFTLPFILAAVRLFLIFDLENFISAVITLIITIGCWKTYIMAKGGKVIDTGGLRLIRGVITLTLILLVVALGFLVIYIIIGGLILILFIIPLALVAYTYHIFRQALTTMIVGFENGSTNTDYYSSSATCLIIFMVIGIILMVVKYTFNPANIPQLNENIVALFQFSRFDKIIDIAAQSISVITYIIMINFIRTLKFAIENIHSYYPKINNIPIDRIDYRISSNIIDSDSEINDRDRY